jgi:hypothetical protein
MPQTVVASWIERFATRLIQLQPQVRPLDAVRNASDAYDSTWQMAPEDAAESYAATDGRAPANRPPTPH